MNYALHPLCTLFPRMSGAEFDALRDDIKANGLRSPITLHDGMILDGGNRYRACIEAGAEPVFEEFKGGNLVAFVMSVNLHRRHMTQGQQAAIVASAQDWAQAQPANRPSDKDRNVAGFVTAADRAAQSGASLRTQQMADKVAKADPALALQVAHGEVTLPAAVAAVSPPKPEPKPATPAPAPDEAPTEKVVEKASPAPAPKAERPVEPAEPAEPSEVERLREQVAEMAQTLEELMDDNRSMAAVFDANDKLAAAMAENKKLRAQVSQLTERVAGLMNEKNAAIRAAKAAQKKLAQMGVAA